MLKTTTPCNRWKIFLSIPYLHVITFYLVWQHHDVFQTSATASKRLRIEPKSCILMQLFEATYVRNLPIVKKSRARKISRVVPRERRKIVLAVPYILKIMSRSLWPHVTKPCCKLLRQTSKIEKLQTSFRMVLLFQGIPLNNYGVECKENSTM